MLKWEEKKFVQGRSFRRLANLKRHWSASEVEICSRSFFSTANFSLSLSRFKFQVSREREKEREVEAFKASDTNL